MGKMRFPEETTGALRELLIQLHKLHAEAGWPSSRHLANGQVFSHHIAHQAFTKPDLPQQNALFSIVDQLASAALHRNPEEDLDRFDALWQRARDELYPEPARHAALKELESGRSARRTWSVMQGIPFYDPIFAPDPPPGVTVIRSCKAENWAEMTSHLEAIRVRTSISVRSISLRSAELAGEKPDSFVVLAPRMLHDILKMRARPDERQFETLLNALDCTDQEEQGLRLLYLAS